MWTPLSVGNADIKVDKILIPEPPKISFKMVFQNFDLSRLMENTLRTWRDILIFTVSTDNRPIYPNN